MKRFKKILVVLQPMSATEPVVDRAMQLARENKAQVTIVSVQPELHHNMRDFVGAILQQQQGPLDALAKIFAKKGISVTCSALTGISFIEIVRTVIRDKHDLLMKTAKGRGGLSKWLFGSTDLHLLRKCPRPVWIVKPTKRKKYARVLAAVDPDPGVEAHEELNRHILELATSLAIQEHSELHVVHAWSVPNEKLMHSGRARMSPKEISRIVRDFKKAHKEQLDKLLAQHDLTGITTRIHMAKGDPASIISSVAKKTRTELVIMGTVARTGVPGFFIGNTAEKTLGALDCSVMAIKPAAFETPVTV